MHNVLEKPFFRKAILDICFGEDILKPYEVFAYACHTISLDLTFSKRMLKYIT